MFKKLTENTYIEKKKKVFFNCNFSKLWLLHSYYVKNIFFC